MRSAAGHAAARRDHLAVRGGAPPGGRAGLLLAAALLVPAGGAAQPRQPVEQLAVDVRPWSTMVAVTVSIPAGSRHDPEGRAGAAWATGHAVASRLRERLDPSVAGVEVVVERSRTVFSILAVPDRWRRAYEALAGALFRDRLEEENAVRARSALMEQLLFQSGAPVREFQDRFYRTLTSGDHPWSRPPSGYPEQASRLELADLEEYRDTHYRPHTVAVSVVGPVDPRRVASLVRARVRASPDDGVVEEEIWGSLAWERGGRTRVVEEVTNTWIGVAFPAPLGTPRTSLEMMASVVREGLNSTPPDPGVYSADATVVETPIGPVLLIVAAVFPEVAERWEREMVDAVRSLAVEAPDPTVFREQLRRFRTEVLLGEAVPEERGARITADLHRRGGIRDLAREMRGLDPGDLRSLASALGEPRVLVFGPELGDGSER